MERLRRMSLKRAFFCLTLVFLIISTMLSVLVFMGCANLIENMAPEVKIEIVDGKAVSSIYHAAESPPVENMWYQILTMLQFLLPILLIGSGLLMADIVFYRVKLKQPLAVLQAGAERIKQHDLDQPIPAQLTNDELGQLCTAFEAMRCALVNNNQELWRQMEERKRLNAAFSHDLRNPVTVLKGSAKMLRKSLSMEDGRSGHTASAVMIQDTLTLMEEYSERIETYVEAMSSAQRLEELNCSPVQVEWQSMVQELRNSLHVLIQDSKLDIDILSKGNDQTAPVWLDKGIVYNVVENIVANAMRYASSQIQVQLTLDGAALTISVQDDGKGFSPTIISKGAEPFLRGEEQEGNLHHFGMGLYICRMLCMKHKGTLSMRNTSIGALTTMTFSVSKP